VATAPATRGKSRDRELLDTVRAALSMQVDAYRRESID